MSVAMYIHHASHNRTHITRPRYYSRHVIGSNASQSNGSQANADEALMRMFLENTKIT